MNVGKGGQVFSDGHVDGSAPHPHFALAKDTGGETFRKQFELSKKYAPYNEAHRAENGATVNVSIWADDSDLIKNVSVAKVVADVLGLNVSIRPHLNNAGKNPEYEFDGGILGDRVSPDSLKNIRNTANNAFKFKLSKGEQLHEIKNAVLVIEIWFTNDGSNVADFASQAWSKFHHYKNLERLILTQGKDAVSISRESLAEGYEIFLHQIKTLF